ncbi:hypothetical protein HN924_03050 [Candidatus Woesearchaeota archaeon]|jgi:hypothetical protein|nr:hypothetical protein [Candidatus Woesearchaeota archaeon]MBT7062920.1 hypothetical protein [Candidatus Woesearchaeota archaeon]MBT7402628.1 hypothetical protein [Candidatus Woesearchaeota archaeon]
MDDIKFGLRTAGKYLHHSGFLEGAITPVWGDDKIGIHILYQKVFESAEAPYVVVKMKRGKARITINVVDYETAADQYLSDRAHIEGLDLDSIDHRVLVEDKEVPLLRDSAKFGQSIASIIVEALSNEISN